MVLDRHFERCRSNRRISTILALTERVEQLYCLYLESFAHFLVRLATRSIRKRMNFVYPIDFK